ncbi:MAG: efflux transporter outer membrane subunit [Lysobacteraceae bacterium]
MIRFPKSSVLVGALLLSACASTPYQTPVVAVPAQYNGSTVAGGKSQVETSSEYPPSDVNADHWWTAFGDSGLDRLVSRVLERNPDLTVATLRVRRAQLSAGLARDSRYPHLSGQLNASNSRDLDSGESSGSSYSAGLSASYEADLWGRLKLAADAATWEATATAEDREATALALVGTAADTYWQLGYLNQRILAGEDSLQRSRRTLELVSTQYEAGAVSKLEWREAQQSLDSQIAALAALRQQRQSVRQALALLLDGEFWAEAAEPQDLSRAQSPEIPPGLPAELLGRRPDLRAAELRLRSSLADVDGTRLSYYPSLSLTGSMGSSSSSLGDLLKNPVATLGAGLSLPFLRFNERQLSIAAAKTDYEIAVIQFRQTLLAALSDVDVTLSARDAWNTQVASLTRSLEQSQEIERLYEVRYRAGAVALRNWLDAQESRRNAELSLAQARLSQLQNDISLFQALGGNARRSEGNDED